MWVMPGQKGYVCRATIVSALEGYSLGKLACIAFLLLTEV